MNCPQCAILAEEVADLRRQLEVLKDRYGVSVEVRMRTDKKEVIRLLDYFAASMRRQGYMVVDRLLSSDNQKDARTALEQHGYQTMTEFIDWFWLMKPTNDYWRTVTVNRLSTMFRAFNLYRDCQRHPAKTATAFDYNK